MGYVRIPEVRVLPPKYGRPSGTTKSLVPMMFVRTSETTKSVAQKA